MIPSRPLPISLLPLPVEVVVRRLFRSIHVLSLVLAAVACSASPSVMYQTQPTGDDKGLIKFYLSGTDLTLAKIGSAPGGVELSSSEVIFASPLAITTDLRAKVKALLTPREDRRSLYAIVPKASWLGAVRTNISVTYFDTADTSLLIKSIGSEVQDDRTKIIAAIGAVAMAAAALAYDQEQSGIGQPRRLRLPVAINLYDAKDGAWQSLPENPGWWYKLLVSPARSSSVKRDEFFTKYNVNGGSETSAFPFSACRFGSLHLKFMPSSTNSDAPKSEEGDVSYPVKLADPNFVDTLQLPDKGSINFHTVCGADLAAENSQVKTSWEILEALMTQVKSVKSGLKDSK